MMEPRHQTYQRGLAGQRSAQEDIDRALLQGHRDAADMRLAADDLADIVQGEAHGDAVLAISPARLRFSLMKPSSAATSAALRRRPSLLRRHSTSAASAAHSSRIR